MKCPACGTNVSILRVFRKQADGLSCTNCKSRLKVSEIDKIEAIVMLTIWPVVFAWSWTMLAVSTFFRLGIYVVLFRRLANITFVDEQV